MALAILWLACVVVVVLGGAWLTRTRYPGDGIERDIAQCLARGMSEAETIEHVYAMHSERISWDALAREVKEATCLTY